MTWLRNAFAVDAPGPAEPTSAQMPAVDWVCLQVARRRLTTPSLIMLEFTRPLNYISAQAMHFFRPGIWALGSRMAFDGYVEFSRFLEQRGSTEYMAKRIEHFEAELSRLERDGGDIGDYIKTSLAACKTAMRDAAASRNQEADGLDPRPTEEDL